MRHKPRDRHGDVNVPRPLNNVGINTSTSSLCHGKRAIIPLLPLSFSKWEKCN